MKAQASTTYLLDEDVKIQKCESCGEKMEYWNEIMTKQNGGDESLDEAGEIWIVWSPKDCAAASFFYCEACNVLQVSCKVCNEPLQCVGHQGFLHDGTVHMRDPATKVKTQLTKPSAPDPKVPRFGISDLGQIKLRLNEWAASGPEYDQNHFWYCSTCDKEFAFRP